MEATEKARAARVAAIGIPRGNRHTILMPEVRTWAELFTETAPWMAGESDKRKMPELTAPEWRHTRKGNRRKGIIAMPIGPYLTWRGREPNAHHGSAAVHPSPAVVEKLRASMVVIERDSVYFQVIEWEPEDGGEVLCLVTADHNQIIGGRWLAVIPLSEVPAFLKTEGGSSPCPHCAAPCRCGDGEAKKDMPKSGQHDPGCRWLIGQFAPARITCESCRDTKMIPAPAAITKGGK